MSSLENYDGLCGIIPNFACSGKQIRCNYEFRHYGPCSFEKHRSMHKIMGGAICSSRPDPERSFIDSVLSHQIKEEE